MEGKGIVRQGREGHQERRGMVRVHRREEGITHRVTEDTYFQQRNPGRRLLFAGWENKQRKENLRVPWEQSPNLKIAPKKITYNFSGKRTEAHL